MQQSVFNLPKLVLLQQHPEFANPAGKAYEPNWAVRGLVAGSARHNPTAKFSAGAEVPLQPLDIARWASTLSTLYRPGEKP
jgi:hypothetical protein